MIGIDIVCIARIERVVDRFGYRGLSRFLLPSEISLCLKDSQNIRESFKNYSPLSLETIDLLQEHVSSKSINISRVAGFWAAKEALSKALGVGIGCELGFFDMIISKDSRNAPQINLTLEKQTYFGVHHIALSISHDSGFAIAAVICS